MFRNFELSGEWRLLILNLLGLQSRLKVFYVDLILFSIKNPSKWLAVVSPLKPLALLL